MREWEQINYLVIDITTNKALVVRSCMVAGRITKLHGNEITIALEENGICETDQYTIVEILCSNSQ